VKQLAFGLCVALLLFLFCEALAFCGLFSEQRFDVGTSPSLAGNLFIPAIKWRV
jgi:hypothetical protein